MRHLLAVHAKEAFADQQAQRLAELLPLDRR
jgi:hypothetical protein